MCKSRHIQVRKRTEEKHHKNLSSECFEPITKKLVDQTNQVKEVNNPHLPGESYEKDPKQEQQKKSPEQKKIEMKRLELDQIIKKCQESPEHKELVKSFRNHMDELSLGEIKSRDRSSSGKQSQGLFGNSFPAAEKRLETEDDHNNSSVFDDGFEVDESDPNKRDVNLFISHLEISRGDLGLDGSGFMDGIFRQEVLNSAERFTPSPRGNQDSLDLKSTKDTKKLLGNEEKENNNVLSCIKKYKVILIAVVVVIAIVCMLILVKLL